MLWDSRSKRSTLIEPTWQENPSAKSETRNLICAAYQVTLNVVCCLKSPHWQAQQLVVREVLLLLLLLMQSLLCQKSCPSLVTPFACQFWYIWLPSHPLQSLQKRNNIWCIFIVIDYQRTKRTCWKNWNKGESVWALQLLLYLEYQIGTSFRFLL